MNIYLVGGAVRDKILNIENNDLDYVVVNSSINEMKLLGFEQVGKSFPVFLNSNGDQFALARKEISTGLSHADFDFDTNNISLKDDLFRRDLTINAIAISSTGEIIDYFNGVSDLNNGIIRHVSEAFIEDPLRIFRVARFAAKFSDFKIADETMILMKKMVKNNLIKFLSIERIYEEFKKAAGYINFYRFLEVLMQIGVELDSQKYIKQINLNYKDISTLKLSSNMFENSNPKFSNELNNHLTLAISAAFDNKKAFENYKNSIFLDKKFQEVHDLTFDWIKLFKFTTIDNLKKVFNQKSIQFVGDFLLENPALKNYSIDFFNKIKFIIESFIELKNNIKLLKTKDDIIEIKNSFFLQIENKYK